MVSCSIKETRSGEGALWCHRYFQVVVYNPAALSVNPWKAHSEGLHFAKARSSGVELPSSLKAGPRC